MTDQERRADRLAALEERVARLEAGVSGLDRRTVGMIRLGGSPAPHVERVKASVADSTHLTTDPSDPRIGRGSDETPRPQNDAYLVLSDEERAKGFLQPVRESYRHVGALTQLSDDQGRDSHRVRTGGCGTVTTMGRAIAETYARNPWFYGSTYCVTCQKHRPLTEFIWPDGSPMDPAEWSGEALARVMARRAEVDSKQRQGKEPT